MTIKAFFVDALTSALELRIATPDDVMKHVTPDVLATHLPRPLWARLLTACLGAPRVDAQLIIDTIGLPNLCEHVPASIIWASISAVAARSLGKGVIAPPPPEATRPTTPTPPLASVGPSIPSPQPTGPEALAEIVSEMDQTLDAQEPRLATLRPRSPTAARFRQSNTAATRLGAARRPQASAPSAPSAFGRTRRGETEVNESNEGEETRVGGDNGSESRDIPVDDSQLVDWQANDNTAVGTGDEDFSDIGRKR